MIGRSECLQWGDIGGLAPAGPRLAHGAQPKKSGVNSRLLADFRACCSRSPLSSRKRTCERRTQYQHVVGGVRGGRPGVRPALRSRSEQTSFPHAALDGRAVSAASRRSTGATVPTIVRPPEREDAAGSALQEPLDGRPRDAERERLAQHRQRTGR